MNSKTLILPVSLLLALAACSSEPGRPDPPRGYFATHIDDGGTKKFQYTMDTPETRTRKSRPGNLSGHASGSSGRGVSGSVTAGSGGRPPQGSGGGYEIFQRLNRQLEDSLEKELKNSDFCLTGYREIERVVEPDLIYIRGECKEMADENDRNRFPNDS